MSDPKITFVEAVEQIRTFRPDCYEAIIEHLLERREEKFANLKRNALTPDCNNSNYFVVTGQLVEADDILVTFKGEPEATVE
ncbi:hypothetical protein RZS08_06800 [Arthrospira platensis SPKY1]|nr:hypothetical protein [Arthrospira platensis SPKY1]